MNSVKKNFIYNILYQMLTIITPLLVTPYISRVLHPEGIGTYAYAYSIANYFVLFTMMGLNNYGNRMVAKHRDDRNEVSSLFCSIYAMQITISFICIIIYCFMTIFVMSSSPLYWIMLIYVVSAGVDITWFFQGMEEFKITVTRNAVIKIISTIGIIIFVKKETDLQLYALIMVGAILANQIALWPFVRRYIDFEIPKLKAVLIHIKPNIVLFIPTIAVSFYRVMDKIMLGAMSGSAEVGFYDSADKLITIPLCIVTAFGTVMMPRMSNLVNKLSTEKFGEIVQKSLSLAVFISTPIMTGMMAIAVVFVPFYYGPGFDKCVYLFYILLPSTLFISMANVIRTQVLLPNELDKVYVASCILGAVTNVVINWLLIPPLGSIGAAIGTLVTEIVVFGVQIIYARHYFNVKETAYYVLLVLFCAGIMGGVVYLISVPLSSIITLVIKVSVGILVYFACLYFAIRFTKNKMGLSLLDTCFGRIRKK